MDCQHILVIDDGEHVCNKCGTIMNRVIDEGAEWRHYEDGKGDEQCRTGFVTSELLPESSYGSMMSYKGVQTASMKSLQRLSSWSLSSNSQRSWMSIFDAIQLSCTHAGLPKSIMMDACAMYKQLEDAQKVRGESRRSLMSAAIFVACRNNGVPRSHEEISKMMSVNIRSLCKAITFFSPTDNTVLQTELGIAERICASLEIRDEHREKIMDLLYQISMKSEDEFEHTPKTIVAGVVAFVLGMKTKASMKPVSDVSGVSTLSIYKIVGKL
uniref:Transcription factor TFIIB cyclin-like domain-containing protein n=1 Tax=viral metagenome TaxID=1070528 RepID=A0A6C0JWM7_9ZZZZ